MEWMIVLRSGTQLQMSQESAVALVAQFSHAALSGAPISEEGGVLVRVQDVLLVAPYMPNIPPQQVKVQAKISNPNPSKADDLEDVDMASR